jgi:hypothetical protein
MRGSRLGANHHTSKNSSNIESSLRQNILKNRVDESDQCLNLKIIVASKEYRNKVDLITSNNN